MIAWKEAAARRLAVLQKLRQDPEAPNSELQAVYGDKQMSTQLMAYYRRAISAKIAHPERYTEAGLGKKLQGVAPTTASAELRKKPVRRTKPSLRVVPSAVDKLAGLKTFLDEIVLPRMLGFTVGSDVQTVVIAVGTDPAGNPTLTRKIGRTVTEWDEHTLDPRREVESG